MSPIAQTTSQAEDGQRTIDGEIPFAPRVGAQHATGQHPSAPADPIVDARQPQLPHRGARQDDRFEGVPENRDEDQTGRDERRRTHAIIIHSSCRGASSERASARPSAATRHNYRHPICVRLVKALAFPINSVETARLLLRLPELADAEALMGISWDPEVVEQKQVTLREPPGGLDLALKNTKTCGAR